MAYQPITDPLPIVPTDVVASISIAANATASGDCASLGGASTYIVHLTGTWSATVQIQLTYDGVTWTNVTSSFAVESTGIYTYQSSGNMSANGSIMVNAAGAQGARIITTAYTSGTVTGVAILTSGVGIVALAGSPTVTTGTGSASAPFPSASYIGASLFSASIGATATAVKTTFGKVFGWSFFNSNSSAAYVQFFNATTGSVTLGSTTPVLSVGIPAGASSSPALDIGWGFATAITVAVTTTRTGSTSPSDTVDLNIAYI